MIYLDDPYQYQLISCGPIRVVQRYKRCINNFIEEQNEAINTHQEASNEAIEEWERFVNDELGIQNSKKLTPIVV